MSDTQNKQQGKKTAVLGVIGLVLVLAVVLIAVLLRGCGGENTEPSGTATQPTEATDDVLDTDVKTFEQLQKLMAMEEDLQITMNVELTATSAIKVVGNKTISGTGKLVAQMGVRDTFSLFDVQANSHLIAQGISMDGNASADGVTVRETATAELKDISIVWPYQYGVAAYGDTELNNISVDNAPTAAVLASFGNVTVNGGSFTNSHSLIMYVEKDGKLELTGDPQLESSGKHGITNRGVLNIDSGSITDCAQYAIVNYASLTIAYGGTEENGAIELAGNEKGGIYNYEKGVVTAQNLNLHDNLHSAVSNNGTMTLSDSVITTSGTNGIYNTADFTGDALTITASSNCGIYNEKPGKLVLTNSSVGDSTKRGVHNKGGVVELDTVRITASGTHGIANTVDDYNNPGTLTANNVTVSGAKTNVYNEGPGVSTTIINSRLEKTERTNVVVTYGAMSLQNTDILGSQASGTYCLQIAKGARCTVSGGGSITGAASRGVTNHGTLNISGGDIYGNNSTASGGGVFTDGTLYITGGSIYGNTANGAGGGVSVGYSSSDPQLVGKLYMTGGSIYNNTATGNGGGIYVSKGTSYNGGDVVYCYASVTGGSIHDNTAEKGTAIMFSADSEFGGNVKIGRESDLYINKNVILKAIELNNHDSDNPVNITVSAPAGTVVMEAADEAAAVKICDAIASMVSTIGFETQGSLIVVNAGEYVNVDGMDMTGAEIVEISDFQALKQAVEGVASGEKRIIKLMNDITMEGTIAVPAGTSVLVTDNGTAVTLLRGMEMTSGAFFEIPAEAKFGLEGSSRNTLTLDGNSANMMVTEASSSLLINQGELHINTVTLQNNYASGTKLDGCYGGLIYAPSGIVNVTDSLLTGGSATNGGAIFISGAQVTLKDTTVTNCTSSASGGAIRYQGGILMIEGGSFSGNTGASGGAIAMDNGVTLQVTDARFESNATSGGHGGAIYMTNSSALEATGVTFAANHTEGNGSYYGGALGLNTASTATLSGCVFDGNYCDHDGTNNGGAIYSGKNTQVEITGASVFENNYVTANGGAIYGNNGAQVTVGPETTFTENRAASGGAAYVIGYTLMIEDSVFTENSATGSGGAFYVKPGDTETVLSISSSSFDRNSSGGYGGVVNVAGAGSQVSFVDCTFTGNTAKAANNANTLMVSGSSALSVKNVTITPADETVGDVRLNAKAVLKVAGNCQLGMIQYAANTAVIHVTETLADGSSMTILPASYTEGDTVVTGETADILQPSVGAMTVVPVSGANWIVDAEGKLYDNTYKASIGDATFKTVEEAIAAAKPGDVILLNGDVTADVTVPTGVTLNGSGHSVSGNVVLEDSAALVNTSVTGNVALNSDADLSTVAVTGKVTVPAGKQVTVGGSFNAETVELAEGAVIHVASALGEDTTVQVSTAVQSEGTVILTGEASLLASEHTKFNVALSDGTLQLGEDGTISKVPFKASIVGKQTYGTLEEAVAAAANGDVIQINNDYTVTAEIVISGKSITIESAGETAFTISRGAELTASAVFNVAADGGLTLTNVTVDGENVDASNALIENYGTFTLSANAMLTRGKTTSGQAAGLVNNDADTAIAVIKGTISDCTGKNGGAIRNYAKATLEIADGALLEGNICTGNGGAIHQNGTLTVGKATFKDNQASSRGGAIHNNGGMLKLTGTVFEGNSLSDTSKNGGGSVGVYAATSAVMENVSFTGMGDVVLAFRGGAIYVDNGATLNIQGTDNTFVNLSAGSAGAIFCDKGSVTVNGASFSDCSATGSGGVLYANTGANVTVTNSTFTNNSAASHGGIINVAGSNSGTYSSASFENCTFAGNHAGSTGNTIRISGSTSVTVKDVTITPYDAAQDDVYIGAKAKLNVSGKCALGVVQYDNASTSVTNVTAALTEGSAIEILPKEYTEGNVVVTEGASGLLAGAVEYITVSDNGTELWAVSEDGKLKKILYVASVNTVQYESFAEAMSAAGSGSTVTLLTDVEANALTVPAGVTLAGEGHTLTGNVTLAATGALSNLNINGDLLLTDSADLTTVTVSSTVTVPAGKTVTVGADFQAGAINLAENAAIRVASALGENTSVPVTAAVQTKGTVILTGDAAVLATEYTKFTMTLTDGKLQLCPDGIIGDVPFKAIIGDASYDTLAEAVANAEDGAVIRLTNDCTVDAQLEIAKTVIITSNTTSTCVITRADTLTDGAVFNITADGNLTLTNVIVDGSEVSATLALVENYGTLTLSTDAILTKGTNTKQAGGLDNQSGATAYIYGTVSNCTGKNGGGIRNYEGATLTLADGALIKENNATSNGGGIHQSGTMTMGVATLESNTATGYSGAIHFGTSGTETIDGTVFTGNTAGTNGGGVAYLSGGRSVTMQNITVTGSGMQDAGNGGAFRIGGSSATLTLQGTNVFSNLNAANGGVIYINKKGIAELKGTNTFNGCTATTGNIVAMQGSTSVLNLYTGCGLAAGSEDIAGDGTVNTKSE